MDKPTAYSASDLISLLEGGKNCPPINFVGGYRDCFRYFFAIGRGNGGYPDRGLTIPESIEFFVGPPACGRHGDMQLLTTNMHSDFYRIRLNESEVVNGTGFARVKKLIVDFVDELEKKPKVLVLCTTCIDELLHTDYSPLAKELKEKFGIRMVHIRMVPILDEALVPNTHELQEAIYQAVEVPQREKKCVNLIGLITLPNHESELYRELEAQGFCVQNMLESKTIDDYDDLALAEANLVVVPRAKYSSKKLKKRFGTEFVEFYETVNPDETYKNYKKLEEQLGITLNVESDYAQTKKYAEEIAEKFKDKRIALGATFDFNPVKMGADMLSLGFNVTEIFAQQVKEPDLPYLKIINETSSSTTIRFGWDPRSLEYAYEPLDVDLAIGIMPNFWLKNPNVVAVDLPEEPFDFLGIKKFYEEIDKTLSSRDDSTSEKKKIEESPFARNWGAFVEDVR